MGIDLDTASRLISLFSHQKVIVMGDYYLDKYIYGRVLGVSPEMPVLRVVEERVDYVSGAAGNIAANFAAFGANVSAFGVIGEDYEGECLSEALKRYNIDVSNLLLDADRVTGTFTRLVIKQRGIDDQHQIRIDKENSKFISAQKIAEVMSRLQSNIGGNHAIFLADYDETGCHAGIISRSVVERVVNYAKDPRVVTSGMSRKNLLTMHGVDYVFCNMKEAQSLGLGSQDDLEVFSEDVRQRMDLKTICITLSEDGVFCASDRQKVSLSTYKDKISDPCGAGDAFASAFILSILAGGTLEEAAALGNHAAGVAVSKKGTWPVKASELIHELKYKGEAGPKLRSLDALIKELDNLGSAKRIVFTNGYFDLFHSGHVHLLQKAKEYGDILIVGINSDRSTRANKGEGRPVLSEIDRIRILTSLKVVDFVTVFDELTPINIIRRIKPDIIVKGGNYEMHEVVGKDIVEGYGGEVHIIPYQGDTTTRNYMHRIKGASDGMRQT